MPYKLLDEQSNDESTLGAIGRHVGRIGTDVATQAAGFPGDILELGNNLIAAPLAEGLGFNAQSYENTPLGKILPTTRKQRESIEESAPSLKPQNQVERFSDEVIKDATTLLSPSQIAKQGSKYIGKGFKQLAKSLGANMLGETIEQQAGNKDAGAWTRAGSLFLLSIIDQEKAGKLLSRKYNEANSKLPQNAKQNTKGLEANLSRLERDITKGRPTTNLAPSEKFVIDEIDKVKSLIQNGKISVEQAMAQKRSLNESLTKLYEAAPDKKSQQRARKLAKQINGYLSNTIEDYGKKNPGFYKPLKEADQAYGAIEQSKWITRWAEKNIKQSPMTTGLLHLVLGPGASALGSATGVGAAYQGVRLLYQMRKSPLLRKHYANTIKAAAKEDSVTFNKYLKELDSAFQEEESKEHWKFVD